MNKSLSKREYEIMSKFALDHIEAITLKEAAKIFKINKEYLKVMFHRLVKKRWLERIEKGKYVIVPLQSQYGWAEHPFVLTSRIIKNYYISYRTALSYYGLTEQIPVYIYIATLQRKSKLVKELQKYRFRFIKINNKKFFGYKKESIENKEVFIANKEKAIIDCLDKERYSGSIIEIAKALSSNLINIKRIKRYALMMKNASLIRRLGYLLDILKKDSEGLIKHIGKHPPIYLSVRLPRKKIEINKKWKLIINLKEEDLLKW